MWYKSAEKGFVQYKNRWFLSANSVSLYSFSYSFRSVTSGLACAVVHTVASAVNAALVASQWQHSINGSIEPNLLDFLALAQPTVPLKCALTDSNSEKKNCSGIEFFNLLYYFVKRIVAFSEFDARLAKINQTFCFDISTFLQGIFPGVNDPHFSLPLQEKERQKLFSVWNTKVYILFLDFPLFSHT